MKRLLLLLVLSAASAWSQDLEKRVVEYRLDNGMVWLLMARPQAPVFAGQIKFKVGGVDEALGQSGIAHLFEHMAFKGTKTIGTTDYEKEKPLLVKIDAVAVALDRAAAAAAPDSALVGRLADSLKALQEEHKKYVKKDEFSEIYSAEGGSGLNAWTSKDFTNYYLSLPANKIELWMLMESDRFKNGVLRELYTERDVAMEERRMRYENAPWGRLYEYFNATAFTAHPYGFPTIGWTSDIAALNTAKIDAFRKKYYIPQNAVGAVVGDIDIEKTKGMIKKYFGDIKPGPERPSIITREPRQPGEKRITIPFDANPQLLMGYHKPGLDHPDFYTYEMIEMLLSNGRTSRLYKALVTEQKVASGVSMWMGPGNRFPNLFTVRAIPLTEYSNEAVAAAVQKELDRLKTEPVADHERQKVLNQLEASFINSLKSNMGMASQLTTYQHLFGTWKFLLGYRENIAKVTADDIMRVAKSCFNTKNRTLAFLEKLETAEKEAAE